MCSLPLPSRRCSRTKASFSATFIYLMPMFMEVLGEGSLGGRLSCWVIISLPKRDPSFFQARTHQIHLQILNSFVSGLCILPKVSRPSASKSQDK